jgi:hypothetical protein
MNIPSPNATIPIPGGGTFPGPGFPGNVLPPGNPPGAFTPTFQQLPFNQFPFNRFWNGAYWNWHPQQQRWLIVGQGACSQWSAPIQASATMLVDAAQRLGASGGAPVSTRDAVGNFYLYERAGNGQIIVRQCVSQ